MLRFLGICTYGSLVAFCSLVAPVSAINVVIDYQYDTNNFFNPGTTNGMAARASIEAAADFFSDAIDDTLDAIPYTDPNTPGGSNTPVWRQVITHPGTGQSGYSISSAANAAQDGLTGSAGVADEFRDIQVVADDFLIYAGATSLGTAGQGGTGFNTFGSTAFNDNKARRGKPTSEYAAWGGYVTFDNDGGSTWHYDHTQPTLSGRTDLYSVALHEIGHVLGLSTSASQWDNWQFGAEYRGPESLAAWKAEDPIASPSATGIPTVSSTNRHWKDNAPTSSSAPSVSSYIVGTTTLQETAMDPVILDGTRKLFTNVDTLALRDIGWSIPNSVFDVDTVQGDYNGNGFVDDADYSVWLAMLGDSVPNGTGADGDGNGIVNAADFSVWKTNFGGSGSGSISIVPEPATMVGLLLSIIFVSMIRRR